ncbi:MAG: hypothetical protein ACYSW4_05405 [Planctomycetota bacterium]
MRRKAQTLTLTMATELSLVGLVCILTASCSLDKSSRTSPIAKSSRSMQAETTNTAGNKKRACASDSSVRVVSPTYGLAELIERFEPEPFEDRQREADFEAWRQELLSLKKSGHTRWGSENWMKEPDYYQSLKTPELIDECFSRAIFVNEMSIYNDPRAGFESLKIFHNGFAELFKREDLWKGVLHLYEHLSARLDPEAELMQIVTTTGHLDELRKLYVLSPLREQVKEGREKNFLAANLRVLKRFQWYLENYDPDKLGTGGSPGFFREPCSVAQMAMVLAKQIDPPKYAKVESGITSVRWTKEQKVQDLRSFISLVIRSLEGFVTEEDGKFDENHCPR